LTPFSAADAMIIAAGAVAPFVVNEATKTFSGVADALSATLWKPALGTPQGR
jgi:hypothetical protein